MICVPRVCFWFHSNVLLQKETLAKYTFINHDCLHIVRTLFISYYPLLYPFSNEKFLVALLLLVALINYYFIWRRWWLLWPTFFIFSMPCQTFTNIWKKKQAIFLPDEIFWSLLDDVKYVFQSTEYISRKEKHDIEGIVREIS